MNKRKTFFDWEDSFNSLENITSDIYVNDTLKLSDVHFDKIDFFRGKSGLLHISFYTKENLLRKLTDKEPFPYNIRLIIKSPTFSTYKIITIFKSVFVNEKSSIIKNYVKTELTADKIEFSSDRNTRILKEWYGCSNKLNFHSGTITSKVTNESITYKSSRKVIFKLENESYNTTENSFWVNLGDYKFKVSIIRKFDNEAEHYQYALEYREKWGLIPDVETRNDICNFMSFVIGSKLIKFGESHFDNEFISQKEYLSLSPIDTSFLYLKRESFYNDDYRHNDTESVIKQIPKMLRRYLKLKGNYRLNEVFSALYIHSYLEFNFINYVTYIEMFANIDLEQKSTVISKPKFREVLKKLNDIKGVPKGIRDKFQNLNTIGVGKKVQRLLSKYKIDYNEYKDVFTTRGKVVHGTHVEFKEMYVASEKAKELLTILTLKKLNYSGYIRNFTNNDELILIKDMSILTMYP